MGIKIFTTGGTIDDLEYSDEKYAPVNQKPLIPTILKSLALSAYTITPLTNKDSRFISDADREVMAKNCIECEENKVVITHGTITMVETAKYLNRLGIKKTIILTGAMIPANKPNSDAQDNVHRAFREVQRLPVGVYISMSGRIFDAENVIKDVEKGIFKKLG